MGSHTQTMSHITTLQPNLVSTDNIIPSNDKMAKIYLTGPGYEINFVPHIILTLFSYQVIDSLIKTWEELRGDDVTESSHSSKSFITESAGNLDQNRFHLKYGEIKLLQRIADIEAKVLGMKIIIEKAKQKKLDQNFNNIFPETDTF